jgi:pimeloyl-ACP methyl ester carboxylesterase
MDAFLPGVEGWEAVYDSPAIWHFRFYGPTPEALVQGRERIFFEHFWNDFAADKNHSIPEADRAAYTAAYSRPGRMRAGFAYFESFPETAFPVLAVGGEKANGELLSRQAKRIGSNVTAVVIPGAGHWILEEKPEETIAALRRFL